MNRVVRLLAFYGNTDEMWYIPRLAAQRLNPFSLPFSPHPFSHVNQSPNPGMYEECIIPVRRVHQVDVDDVQIGARSGKDWVHHRTHNSIKSHAEPATCDGNLSCVVQFLDRLECEMCGNECAGSIFR